MTTSSGPSLCDAYRADAAELAKFLDQLCLTLQQGKALQKRFAQAVDRLDAAHKAEKVETSAPVVATVEVKGGKDVSKETKEATVTKEVSKDRKNGKNGDAPGAGPGAADVDATDAGADTTDATTDTALSRPAPDSSSEEPPPRRHHARRHLQACDPQSKPSPKQSPNQSLTVK